MKSISTSGPLATSIIVIAGLDPAISTPPTLAIELEADHRVEAR
jgi:hypothetical protein